VVLIHYLQVSLLLKVEVVVVDTIMIVQGDYPVAPVVVVREPPVERVNPVRGLRVVQV